MQYETLGSEKELRDYIHKRIAEDAADRQARNVVKPATYFRLHENLGGVVVFTLNESTPNEKLKRDIPDAGSSYHSFYIPAEAIQAFKVKWEEAKIEAEAMPRPRTTTYYIQTFQTLTRI